MATTEDLRQDVQKLKARYIKIQGIAQDIADRVRQDREYIEKHDSKLADILLGCDITLAILGQIESNNNKQTPKQNE